MCIKTQMLNKIDILLFHAYIRLKKDFLLWSLFQALPINMKFYDETKERGT